MASCTSPRASTSTLPISRTISRATVLRAAQAAAPCGRIAARVGAGSRLQSGKAAAAASAASSTSSYSERANEPTTSEVRLG